ncbi:hypothetical protein HSBAA_29370 [Vreelandella sulfidaeris]|uniref:PhoH-like protein domain-containing protein n=1 Tax=Vreelandella sulfidaeris TaxID=115553 RepID=A0A455UAN5_9GAMM|nr:hypothetical protein HSBAA_29370 [Halomonas sulfidaeris]
MSRSNRKQQKNHQRQADRRDKHNCRNSQPTEQYASHHRTQAGAVVTEDVARYLAQAQTRRVREPIEARTEAQGHYACSISGNDITFGIGPAGTGKTFVSTAMACDALLAKEVDKIVITRPVVEADENMGFLPGDVGEICALLRAGS